MQKTLGVLRHLGPRWALFRVWHAGRIRTGALVRKDPVRKWSVRTDDAGFRLIAPRVMHGLGDRTKLATVFSMWDRAAAEPPVVEADELLSGIFRLFGWRKVALGQRPAWGHNPLLPSGVSNREHWSQISDFGNGDIKLVWETSRWSWALTLARAFARTGDRRYAVRFRELRDSWMKDNPPGTGANWKCGQEAAMRLIAACVATRIFSSRGEMDMEDLSQLAALADATGRRIESNLAYALSQDNNHGLSELAGLLTVAVMFPDLPGAGERREKARAGLIREIERLVAPDGSFAQYSTNYHRVLLHDAVWCGRLLTAAGEPFPETTMQRLDAAANWLWQMMETSNGDAFCYGSNDGANFLKLDGGVYGDYRASIQAVFVLTRGAPVLPAGYWDETAVWLFGPEVLLQRQPLPERGETFSAKSAGYYVLRRAGTEVFVRCGPHRFRPHHADQLHLDLRRNGRPLTIGSGTFSYNAPPPWDHAFKNTRFHNTVSVDGLDQMEKAGRFLWLPWTSGSGEVVGQSGETSLLCWEGETDAWSRLAVPVRHRRAILLHTNGDVTVIDRLQSAGEHEYRLHWLLADAQLEELGGGLGGTLSESEIALLTVGVASGGAEGQGNWRRADHVSGRGWASPRYQELVPAWSWEIKTRGTTVWFATHFGTGTEKLFFAESTLVVGGATFRLGTTPHGRLVEPAAESGLAS